jgi:hypothetical protein
LRPWAVGCCCDARSQQQKKGGAALLAVRSLLPNSARLLGPPGAPTMGHKNCYQALKFGLKVDTHRVGSGGRERFSRSRGASQTSPDTSKPASRLSDHRGLRRPPVALCATVPQRGIKRPTTYRTAFNDRDPSPDHLRCADRLRQFRTVGPVADPWQTPIIRSRNNAISAIVG